MTRNTAQTSATAFRTGLSDWPARQNASTTIRAEDSDFPETDYSTRSIVLSPAT